MPKLLHLLSISITALLCLLLVVIQPFPFLHDYLEWMYQGWLFNELLNGANASVVEQFALVSHPVPNSVSQVAIGFLNNFVSPVMAGKIWLAIYFLFSAILWWLVAQKRGEELSGAFNLLLTLTISLGAGFWNGYANFQFGLLFLACICIVQYCAMYGQPGWCLCFHCCFFSLMLQYLALFFVFVSFQFLFTQSRWRVLLALLPSLALLFWYTSIKLAADNPGLSAVMSWAKWAQYKAYTVAKQGPFHNFILHDGESLLANLNPVYMAGFAINFIILLLMISWLAVLVWRFF